MRSIILSVSLLSVVAARAAEVVALDVLLKSPDKHHEKVVVAKGKVEDLENKVSKRGNPYTVFKLVQGKATVNVYVRGKMESAPKNGQMVQVTGIFRKEKKLRDFVVKNEIDASPSDDKKHGVKVIGK
jgi:DNA polymerase III alpha subunit